MIGTNMQEALAPVALRGRERRHIRATLVAAAIVIAAGAGVGTWQAWPHGSAVVRTNVSGVVQTDPALDAFKRLKQEAYTDPGTTQRLDAFKRLKNGD